MNYISTSLLIRDFINSKMKWWRRISITKIYSIDLCARYATFGQQLCYKTHDHIIHLLKLSLICAHRQSFFEAGKKK